KERAENLLHPYLQREKQIETRIAEIELKERETTDATERHQVEEERWKLEEERRNQEKEKWEAAKNLETTLKKIDEVTIELDKLRRGAQVIDAKIEESERQIERKRIEIELVGITKHKEELE